MMASFLQFPLLFSLCMQLWNPARVTSQNAGLDLTRTPEASGEAVTKATIALIQESCIFSNDYLFLRRIANAISDYGRDSNTFRPGFHGGIWKISQGNFFQTMNVPGIDYATIESHFSIDWSQVVWQDLRKPLFSGLAAMLILERRSPIPKDVNGQGEFCRDQLYVKKGRNKEQRIYDTFINKTSTLNLECGSDNLDIAFVLDASGSVSPEDYEGSKKFTAEVAKKFNIGVNAVRVAVMSFSSSVTEHIVFSDTHSSASLARAIDSIGKIAGGTNTHLALNTLRTSVFTDNGGSRSDAARIAIIQTDGQSNSTPETLEAAKRLRDEGIIVFAIGLGSGININELNGMASSPICSHVRLLDFRELNYIIADIKETTCETEVIQAPDVANVYNCSGQTTIRFDPGEETSVITRPEFGKVNIFGSFQTTQPNSAFADFIRQSSDDKPTILYLNNSTQPLYISLVSESHKGSTTCDSTVLVKTVSSNELQKTAASNICIKGGNLATCRDIDYIRSNDYVTSDSSLPSNVTSVCSTSPPGYHAHPDTNTKYIYCVDATTMYVVDCPPGFGYLDSQQDCITPASTEPDQICKVCSANNFQIGLRKFPLSTSIHQYVSCLGVGNCSIQSCATEYRPTQNISTEYLPAQQACRPPGGHNSGSSVVGSMMMFMSALLFTVFFRH